MRTTKLIVFVCFLGFLLTAWPLFAQESTADVLQNWKISQLQDAVAQHDKLLAVINEKMTYTQGGVAGIYALLGVIGLFNLRLIQKKP